jgi:hypothetical protein
MEWLAAPNNAEYGVGRELVTAQDKTCEKWKQKFHDFKPVEKVGLLVTFVPYLLALS